MIYFDTAYILKCYLHEPGSLQLCQFLKHNTGLASCALARLEFVTALHRQIREKLLTKREIEKCLDEFYQDIEDGLWFFFPISLALLESAERWVASFSVSVFLRSNDALHLACAKEQGFNEIYSNDRHLLAAASHFGLRGINILDQM